MSHDHELVTMETVQLTEQTRRAHSRRVTQALSTLSTLRPRHTDIFDMKSVELATMEPLLTATPDKWPPSLWRPLTLVPNASLYKTVPWNPWYAATPLLRITATFLAPNNARQYKITSHYRQPHPLPVFIARIIEYCYQIKRARISVRDIQLH